jgi:hypothetical protein
MEHFKISLSLNSLILLYYISAKCYVKLKQDRLRPVAKIAERILVIFDNYGIKLYGSILASPTGAKIIEIPQLKKPGTPGGGGELTAERDGAWGTCLLPFGALM